MNGASAVNGTHAGAEYPAQSEDVTDSQVLQALQLIHESRSSNEQRQEASQYLEQLKAQEGAPYKGFLYASNKQHPTFLRYYGLSLLESVIRHRWYDYSGEQSSAVRGWVLDLAQGVDVATTDPSFIRNKVAQLWVEVAKRSWALDWMNMDEMLVNLWSGPAVRKVLVLEVLENLSENSFGKEDATAVLRGQDLSKACVEIFTPARVMLQHFPARDTNVNVRYGSEGWLTRVADFIIGHTKSGLADEETAFCVSKALSTLKSILSWAILPAVASSNCVEAVCGALGSSNRSIELAAIETLFALYSRPAFTDEDVVALVGPLYEDATIERLRAIYRWSVVAADDIDDEKYLICKKLAEAVHAVGKYMADRPDSLPESANYPAFLDLLVEMLRNESLHVSIPILHLWAKLLASRDFGNLEAMSGIIGPLLELCSQRLLRFEALAQDADVPALIFLNEDLDTVPEKHAFLGNYARFCRDVVDSIVSKRPFDALQHILNQADHVLQHLYDGEPSFEVSQYKKASIPALKLDAQFSVIEAALSGYTHWRTGKYKQQDPGPLNQEQEAINTTLENWCRRLFNARFDEPGVQQRITILVAEFALDPLKRNPDFVQAAFQYLVETKRRLLTIPLSHDMPEYNEAIKDLHRLTSHQVQRIALKAADFLIQAFAHIEDAVSELCQMPQMEEDDRDRCVSVLFIIIQRASELNEEERLSRLETYVGETMSKWSAPQLASSLQTFDGFCNLLSFSGFQDYFSSRGALRTEDWSTSPLDEEGRIFRIRVEGAQRELPLRATTTFFSVSLDKTEPGSQPYETALTLWSKYLPAILPNVLQLISLSHMFSNPAAWTTSSEESKVILSRILRDRFWQVGISSGSRDEFYNRVEQSKSTLEGLASVIRGSLRLVRDKCYRLLSSTSLLGETIYRLDGLPPIMAKAIFEHSPALSTHQTGIIIDMMRPIIENCPPDARERFLTPLITAMFDSLDQKISSEWHAIDQRSKAAANDDGLQEEMKNESILRQLTYNCVMLVVRLLDPKDGSSGSKDHAHHNSKSAAATPGEVTPMPATLRNFVLGNPQVFKSVVLFSTHALHMHDNRCCGLITRVLRSIVGDFAGSDSVAGEIREFISSEVFKACIVSLHDPYFVDIQSDLAQLIATIIRRYSAMTDTPRQILLSLPNMDQQSIVGALHQIFKADNASRLQRAIVLKLLENLRGVSISEQGRLPKPDPKKARSALQEEYMTVEQPRSNVDKERSPDLGGVANMFA